MLCCSPPHPPLPQAKKQKLLQISHTACDSLLEYYQDIVLNQKSKVHMEKFKTHKT